MNWNDRKRQQKAWVDWIGQQELAFFVTLIFNRDLTAETCRRKLKTLCARIDRLLLGRNWYKTKSHKRTRGFAVLEHIHSNIHWHLLIILPATASHLSAPALEQIIMGFWLELVPSGSCSVKAIYSAEGAAAYAGKELSDPESYRHFVILSEFHASSRIR